MRRGSELGRAFVLAVLLHGLAGAGIVWLHAARAPSIRPAFPFGPTTLAVALVGPAEAPALVEPAAIAAALRSDPPFPPALPDPEPPPADPAVLPPSVAPPDWLDEDWLDDGPVPDRVPDRIPDRAPTVPAPPVRPAPMDMTRLPDPAADFARAAHVPAPEAGPGPDRAAGPAAPFGVSGGVGLATDIRPYYPFGARLRGEEGRVTVRVRVAASGRASACDVLQSSGYPALDRAALDAARRARYMREPPHLAPGDAETELTFRFQLRD